MLCVNGFGLRWLVWVVGLAVGLVCLVKYDLSFRGCSVWVLVALFVSDCFLDIAYLAGFGGLVLITSCLVVLWFAAVLLVVCGIRLC